MAGGARSGRCVRCSSVACLGRCRGSSTVGCGTTMAKVDGNLRIRDDQSTSVLGSFM